MQAYVYGDNLVIKGRRDLLYIFFDDFLKHMMVTNEGMP